jgi:hypothetical protein
MRRLYTLYSSQRLLKAAKIPCRGSLSTLAVLAASFVAMMTGAGSKALAQTSMGQFGARVGSGLEIGGGEGSETVKQASPIFVDLDIRTWTDEQGAVIWGGSLRMEVEGKASIAAVPRLELRRMLGKLELRPGVAVPMFLSPFLMFGLEGGNRDV